MRGIQCPKCLRHEHEEFIGSEKGKNYLIDRCAEATCKHNFDITELEPNAAKSKAKNKDDRSSDWGPTSKWRI